MIDSIRDTAKFCATQIDCILRYVQNVYPNHKLENHLSFAIVLLEELARTGEIKK